MIRLTWDTETALFGPGRMAPPLSCVSWMQESDLGLLDHVQCADWFAERLADPNIFFVGHNIAYDMAVLAAEHPRLLPLIFKAYRENRVTCTWVRMRLLDNAIGKMDGYWTTYRTKEGNIEEKFVQIGYSLDDCYYRVTKKRLDKDTYRLHYGELRGVPLHAWPEGARKYPLDDVIATDAVFVWQEQYAEQIQRAYCSIPGGHIQEPEPLADQWAQARSSFWIQLMAVWGIRTDPSRVTEVEQFAFSEIQNLLQGLQYAGLKRADGSSDTKAAHARMIAVMQGEENCKKTKTGRISLTEEACRASGDGLLADYAEVISLQNVLNKDIPALLRGKELPIHARWNSLKATGRTATSDPNIQNIRRLPGIRECFVPRDGKVFLDCDYDGLELRTLAQACLTLLGKSRLAELINAGMDPHLMFAADMLHISYEEAVIRLDQDDSDVKDKRQLAKAANFGFPGGLGIKTFIQFARGYGVFLSEVEAADLKAKWLRTFPEMEAYFALISRYTEEDKEDGLANVEQLFTKRLRGAITYTAACNTYFQGLGADATKAAGFLIAYECYVDESSPLFGCRIVNYIHDQFLVECDEDKSHAAAHRLAYLMVKGAEPFLPDVPALVSKPMVTRCWSKDAKQKFSDTGELIPWDKEFVVKKRVTHAA